MSYEVVVSGLLAKELAETLAKQLRENAPESVKVEVREVEDFGMQEAQEYIERTFVENDRP